MNEHFLIIEILQGQTLPFYVATRNSDIFLWIILWKFILVECVSLCGFCVCVFLISIKTNNKLDPFLWCVLGWHMLNILQVKNGTKPATFLTHNLDVCTTYYCFSLTEWNKIRFRIFKLWWFTSFINSFPLENKQEAAPVLKLQRSQTQTSDTWMI